MIADQKMLRAASVFKALGSPIRIRMLMLVEDSKRPLHIKAVAERLNMDYAAVYRHVRVLQTSGLVNIYEVGRSRVLSLNNREMIKQLIDLANKTI